LAFIRRGEQLRSDPSKRYGTNNNTLPVLSHAQTFEILNCKYRFSSILVEGFSWKSLFDWFLSKEVGD